MAGPLEKNQPNERGLEKQQQLEQQCLHAQIQTVDERISSGNRLPNQMDVMRIESAFAHPQAAAMREGFVVEDQGHPLSLSTVAGKIIPKQAAADGNGGNHEPKALNVTSGVQNLQDVADVTYGVRRAFEQPLDFLSKPNAVNEAVASTLDQWSKDPYAVAKSIANEAVQTFNRLSHPMTQEQIGKIAGELMPAFSAEHRGIKKTSDVEAPAGDALKNTKAEKLSGAGGDWPILNERASPDVVRQTEKHSCVSACGEMVSDGALAQSKLVEDLGSPCRTRELANVLGPEWKGGNLGPQHLDALLDRGPLVVELRELPGEHYRRAELSHSVVVDGLDKNGNIKIRDPADGTKYEMTRKAFLEHWNGESVFKK